MPDSHIADGLLVLRHGGLHCAVGVHHVGGLHDGALVQRALHEHLAGAAAVFAGVQGDGGVGSAELLPVGDLAVVDVGGLLGGDVGHVVGGIDHEGHAVNGEGECFQAEFFNFLVLQRAARVADLDEPFAHLLYAHAGTAARHGDADVGIGGHDAFGGFLHDRDMGGASGDIQSAFHAFKGIKGGGHGGGGQKERCGESGEQELFHGVLTRYK